MRKSKTKKISLSNDSSQSRGNLSSELHLTEGYFSRSFKKQFGETFRKHRFDSRMGKAMRLLIETNLPIITIAIETGYHYDDSFCRSFKKYTGMSPNQYRVSKRNKRK